MDSVKIRPSELGLGRLFERAQDAVIVADAGTGDVLLWNPAATEIFGYSLPEALDMNIEALVPDRLKERHRAGMARYRDTGHGRYVDSRTTLDLPAVRKDGKEIHIEMTLSPISPVPGSEERLESRSLFVLAIIRDVTDRKRAEKKLREAHEELELRVVERTAELERANETLKKEIVERRRAEDDLKQSEERFRSLTNAAFEGIAVTENGKVLDANRAFAKMLGYETQEIMGMSAPDLHPPEYREDVRRKVSSAFSEPYESVMLKKSGACFDVEIHGKTASYDGRSVRVTAIRDVTERKRAEEALRKSEERYRSIFENAVEGIFQTSFDGRFLELNPAMVRIFGYGSREQMISEVRDTRGLWIDPEAREKLAGLMNQSDSVSNFEFRARRRDGSIMWLSASVRARRSEGGDLTGFEGAVEEITERKSLEERLQHQALHDTLTGLPNRALLLDRLRQALTRTDRRDTKVAILFLDLDNFKYVNDTLGHEAGDELLAETANRLRNCLRPEDTVARLGGDEFVVLLENISREDEAMGVAERIIEALQPPVCLEGREVFVTPSVGLAFGASGEERPGTLLRDADLAMYRAKEGGKNHCVVFDPRLKDRSSRRFGMESDLRRALRRPDREFRVHYQPQTWLETGEIAGVEALLRWEHPERGMIPPVEFIPLAEETGLIVPLGRWVLREACRQVRAWHEEHPDYPPLKMSVNLSPRQIRDPGLAQEVTEILDDTGVDPASLVLEITESAAIWDAPSAFSVLRSLKDLGVSLAVDDFGTGYSSLSHLKLYPIDIIKVDRSIVSGLEQNPGDKAIVSATITLAHALGLEVVAEGVETHEEMAELRNMACDMGQGYYWWKPRPAEETGLLLASELYSS